MNALSQNFLRAAELRALAQREAFLSTARSLNDLPDRPLTRGERGLMPLPPPKKEKGGRVPMSLRLAVLRASREEGVTYESLAERFGRSERTILRWLKGTR